MSGAIAAARWALVTLAFVAGLGPRTARAYVPYTTPNGTPLHWVGDVVHYSVADGPPASLTRAGVQRVCADSFAAWGELACHRVTATFDGFVAGLRADQSDHVNAFVWIHDLAAWRAEHSVTELARTAVTHRVTSGEIVDADVVVNAGGFTFSEALACGGDGYDLQSTFTHEIGHLFGLDHAPLADATMAATADMAECAKRTLAPDDVAGYCATYEAFNPPEPAPEARADASSGDVQGAELAEGPTGTRDDGCSAGAGAGASALAATLLLGFSAALRARRRRRPARRASRAR